MNNFQSYCTLQELNEDADGVSLPVSVVERFILPASEYLNREIGMFLPVLETRKLRGDGSVKLGMPPLLRVTGSIINDDTTLDAADYLLMDSTLNDTRAWLDGPYTVLLVAPDATNLVGWSTEANSITLPAAWGLYERARTLAATLTAKQEIASESLSVSDGSQVSPGMVLKLGDEWELVKNYGAVSAAVTTLAANLDAASEIISLADGTKVKIGEIIRCGFEKMRVIDIQTNSAYVARGWDRTGKIAHTSGAGIDVYRTYGVERAVNGSTAAEHASASSLLQMVVPKDVNYLARQIATLMMRKSQSGYSGRAGNAENGETFYTYEFPRDAIERVKRNYLLV